MLIHLQVTDLDDDSGGAVVHGRHLLGIALTATLFAGACSDVANVAGDQPTQSATTTSPATTPTSPEPTTATPTETTQPPEPKQPTPVARQCRRLPPSEAVLGVAFRPSRAVPCVKAHNAQTYFVGRLDGGARTAAQRGNRGQVYAQASGRCRRNLVDWLGGDGADLALSQFTFVVGVPSADDLSAGARWLRCDVVARRTLSSFLALPRSTAGILTTAKAAQYHVCVKGDIAQAKTVVCRLPHRWRGATAVRLGSAGSAFPGGKVVTARMRSTCETQVRNYLGTTSAFSYGWIRPTRSLWQRGERYGICFAKLTS